MTTLILCFGKGDGSSPGDVTYRILFLSEKEIEKFLNDMKDEAKQKKLPSNWTFKTVPK